MKYTFLQMLQENSWSCINYHINCSVLQHGPETVEDMVMSHLGKHLHDGCRWKLWPSFLPKKNNHKERLKTARKWTNQKVCSTFKICFLITLTGLISNEHLGASISIPQ